MSSIWVPEWLNNFGEWRSLHKNAPSAEKAEKIKVDYEDYWKDRRFRVSEYQRVEEMGT